MNMIERAYYIFHRAVSHPRSRGTNSAGFWQNTVRNKALELCRLRCGRLLEIGCGEGIFLLELSLANPGLDLVGIDNDPAVIQAGRRRIAAGQAKNITLVCGEGDNAAFGDGSFDTVVCINVFLNIDRGLIKRILAQMHRLCKPHGRIIFDFRNRLNPLLVLKYRLAPYYDKTLAGKQLNAFLPKDIFSALQEAGFSVAQQYRLGSLIKPLAPLVIVEAEKQ